MVRFWAVTGGPIYAKKEVSVRFYLHLPCLHFYGLDVILKRFCFKIVDYVKIRAKFPEECFQVWSLGSRLQWGVYEDKDVLVHLVNNGASIKTEML